MLELIFKRLIAGMVTLFAASVFFFAATEIQTGDFATATPKPQNPAQQKYK